MLKLFSAASVAALATLLTVTSVLAQVGPAPAPPTAAASAVGSGVGAGIYFAGGIIGTATWFTVLNPKKGSDSILSNSTHGTWRCRLDGKDLRPRCSVFNELPLAERKRLYAQADAR